MAQGYCYLPVQVPAPLSGFTDAGGYWLLVAPNTGVLEFQIGGNGLFNLFDEDDNYLGEFNLGTLPLGFQFISTIPNYSSSPYLSTGFLWNYNGADEDALNDAGKAFLFYIGATFDPPPPAEIICNYWNTSFGWTNISHGSFTQVTREAFLAGFTGEVSFTALDASSIEVQKVTNPVGLDVSIPGNGYLFGYFIVGWDTNGPVGPPLGPIQNPEILPGPAVQLTPPPETTIIVIEIPNEPIIEEPVTPGVPIVIPLPGGTTIIKVTPTNPGVNAPGPTTIIPVDLDQEEPIVIDLVLNFGIQLIANPAGIYTLVPGKTNDTLYERVAGTTTATSQVVAIPRPFGITNYIPEE